MKLFNYDTISIASCYLYALHYGEHSALDDADYITLDQFESKYKGFNVTFENSSDETHFTKCDICGLGADCYDVNIWLQLIHDKDSINYIPDLFIIKTIETDKPLTNNVSGYGSKLPTSKMIKCADGYTRRVYARCYSNAASLYIIVQGKEFYL